MLSWQACVGCVQMFFCLGKLWNSKWECCESMENMDQDPPRKKVEMLCSFTKKPFLYTYFVTNNGEGMKGVHASRQDKKGDKVGCKHFQSIERVTQYESSGDRPMLGLGRLCSHNFEHNR